MIARLRFLTKVLQWKLIHSGPRRDVTINTSNGLLTCDSKDWLIGKYLYVNRSYEETNIRNTLNLLYREGYLSRENSGTVLDVGANIGMICIALLKHNYFKRAIAFEPDPNNFRLLLKNVEQNGLENQITCFPYALSSVTWAGSGTEVTRELELSPDNSGDHRLRYSNDNGAFQEERRQTIKVIVKTVDEIFANNPDLSYEEASLIWVDIQGHEGYFFEGAQHFLSRRIPVVSEFWPYGIKRSGMSPSDYCSILVDIFSHFYCLHSDQYKKRPITEIGKLFEIYNSPRQFGQIILVNDG